MAQWLITAIQEHKPLRMVLVRICGNVTKVFERGRSWEIVGSRGCDSKHALPNTGVVQHLPAGSAGGLMEAWAVLKGVLQFPLFYNFIFLLWKNHHEGSDKGSQNYLMCREWGSGVWGVWTLFLAAVFGLIKAHSFSCLFLIFNWKKKIQKELYPKVIKVLICSEPCWSLW